MCIIYALNDEYSTNTLKNEKLKCTIPIPL